MNMKRFVAAIFALPLFVGANSIASYAADARAVDDGAGAAAVYSEGDARDWAGAVRSERVQGYGWRSRPLDCGVYHYWNGTTCVDSRVVPPDIGPK
jgi:hypothetical protein